MEPLFFALVFLHRCVDLAVQPTPDRFTRFCAALLKRIKVRREEDVVDVESLCGEGEGGWMWGNYENKEGDLKYGLSSGCGATVKTKKTT